MKAEVDMHFHSNFSDGSCSPAELVLQAKHLDLKLISLTDHETFSGIDEFIEVANKFGIIGIPGIELPANFEGMEIHILAYGGYTEILKSYLELCRDIRNQRVITQLALVSKEFNRNDLSLEDLKKVLCLKTESVLYWHLSDYLHCKLKLSFQEIQALVGYHGKFLVSYEVDKFLSHDQLVSLLNGLGFLTVLAHPGEQYSFLKKNDFEKGAKFDKLFAELKDSGLNGVEIYNNKHTRDDINRFSVLADKYNLFKSAGSDWHGKYTPDFSLGVNGVSASQWLNFLRK